MLALAVIDVGYLSSGICAVFDRGSRRLLVDENPVLPPICSQVAEEPADGMSARLFGPRIRARLQRVAGRVSIQARWAHADVDLLLDATRAPPPITAIAPVGPPGRFDFTHKTVLLPAEGEVRAGNVRFPVHGQFAGLDYTHGYLARETAWRWAFACGRAGGHLIAFNFSEGFLQGEGENAVWMDGEPHATGPVRFSFDPGSVARNVGDRRADRGSEADPQPVPATVRHLLRANRRGRDRSPSRNHRGPHRALVKRHRLCWARYSSRYFLTSS